jgi:hypothetical protein
VPSLALVRDAQAVFTLNGTVAIEAAGLLLGLAPGRLRPPPFYHTNLFDGAA